ncbi:hypothetical protein, partial [Bacillus cereus]|uniref:hypothetical protein n=1 Tax=Bacillus cereus TaxID=1396 RepID=UPI0019D59B6C
LLNEVKVGVVQKIKGIKIKCSDFTHSIFLKHGLSYKRRVSMRNSLYFTIWDGYSLNWWSMITSGGDSLTGKVFYL